MYKIQAIGEVKSQFDEPTDLHEMRKYESKIVVKPKFEDGLYKIENSNYLQVVFFFHLSKGYNLIGKRYHGEEKVRGVFASRSPKRPSPLGVTTVELLERKGNVLIIKGLDALDGTPVVDIKPYADILDAAGKEEMSR